MGNGSSKTLQVLAGLSALGALVCWFGGLVMVLTMEGEEGFQLLKLFVIGFIFLFLFGATSLIVGSQYIRHALAHWFLQYAMQIGFHRYTKETLDEFDPLNPENKARSEGEGEP